MSPQAALIALAQDQTAANSREVLEKVARGKYPQLRSKFPDSPQWIANANACSDTLLNALKAAETKLDRSGWDGDALLKVWTTYLRTPGQIADKDLRLSLEVYTKAFSSVLRSCFSPANRSSLYKRLDLANYLGQIYWDDVPRCTALRISDEYLVTAKHCFYDEKTGKALAAGLTPVPNAAWFVSAARPKDRQQICALAGGAPAGMFGPSFDVQYVRTAPSGVTPIKLQAPSARYTATVGAVESIADPPTTLEMFIAVPNARLLIGSPDDFLQFTGFPCFVAAANTDWSCFQHFCGTFERSSGAAVFSNEKDNATYLAGIHSGTNVHDDRCPLLNLGTNLNTASKVLQPELASYLKGR